VLPQADILGVQEAEVEADVVTDDDMIPQKPFQNRCE
jgi:hypothetical protein